MTQILLQIATPPHASQSPRNARPREADIIAARIASERHWRRRRAWLRLRAALFGRGMARPAARSAASRPPQARRA